VRSRLDAGSITLLPTEDPSAAYTQGVGTGGEGTNPWYVGNSLSIAGNSVNDYNTDPARALKVELKDAAGQPVVGYRPNARLTRKGCPAGAWEECAVPAILDVGTTANDAALRLEAGTPSDANGVSYFEYCPDPAEFLRPGGGCSLLIPLAAESGCYGLQFFFKDDRDDTLFVYADHPGEFCIENRDEYTLVEGEEKDDYSLKVAFGVPFHAAPRFTISRDYLSTAASFGLVLAAVMPAALDGDAVAPRDAAAKAARMLSNYVCIFHAFTAETFCKMDEAECPDCSGANDCGAGYSTWPGQKPAAPDARDGHIIPVYYGDCSPLLISVRQSKNLRAAPSYTYTTQFNALTWRRAASRSGHRP
jgi:hypothetical protein